MHRLLLSALACVVLLTIALPARALPAGWKEYTVVAGDTCASVAQKAYGDAGRYDLVHEGNPDLGPQPHNLKPGQVLKLPPVPPDAKLTSVRNVVEVNATPGRPNHPLFRGNRVRTAESAAAEIEFRDTTDLALGENTLVVIFGDTAARATKTKTAADVTLLTGRLRAHLSELAGGAQPPPLSVATAAGTAQLGVGESQVHVDEHKTTRFAVYQGHSTITASHKTIKVDEGFGSKANEGKPPTPPRPLPPAPIWSTPFPALAFARDGAGATAVGTYAAGTGPGDAPAGWHVAIAKDESFRDDVVVDTRVAVGVVRLEARPLQAGTYFARVSAIDADKFEGPYGPVAKIKVVDLHVSVEPHHRTTLAVDAGDVACAVGEGPLAKVQATLTADRHVATRLRCALSEGAPAAAWLELPADRLGPLGIQVRWTKADARTREGEIAVDVVDADGQPVATPTAVLTTTTPGVELLETRADGAPGHYLARVRWTASARTVALHVRLSDQDEGESAPLVIERPVIVHHWESSVGIGGVATPDAISSPYAVHVELGVAFKAPAGPGWVVVGARGSFEDGAAATFALGVPLTYRFGRGTPRVSPYVVVTPEVLFERTHVAATTGEPQTLEAHSTVLGLTGAIGAQLHLGLGALFLEGGYRETGRASGDANEIAKHAGVLTLGYRGDL